MFDREIHSLPDLTSLEILLILAIVAYLLSYLHFQKNVRPQKKTNCDRLPESYNLALRDLLDTAGFCYCCDHLKLMY